MIQESLQKSLNLAYQKAHQKGHEYVTVEHILYGLMSNDDVCDTLTGCGAQLESIADYLEDYFDNKLENDSLPEGESPQPTLGFQRVLQTAAHHILAAGHTEIDAPSVLIAIFDEEESHAAYFLKLESLDRIGLLEYVSHRLYASDEHLPSKRAATRREEKEESTAKPATILEEFTRNLCELAREGKVDPVIGRSEEITRMIHILARRRKNNPLLVGEAGVGKTAIAEGLAYSIVEGNVPESIQNMEVYALDLGSLLAGTKYRGDFEQRFKTLLSQFQEHQNRVLFIDEIHTLMGAGSVSGSPMDASNLLKPLLSSGDVRCIGSTTYKEFREHIESDHAMARRFQKIDVEEPTIADAIRILEGLQERYENHHQVKFTSEAVRAAVTLSDRYLRDRKLPDKAIDVLDEAGATAQLESKVKPRRIQLKAIRKVVANMARIPVDQLQHGDAKSIVQVQTFLKSQVFGQDEAIEALQGALELSKVGLGSEEGLIGSFLFVGPTGVGKTEVSRQLAVALNVQFQRFDMSEYMESHSVARLLGAPPGYVGHDEGGMLTNAIHKTPHCVLLLDEIEKAHPDILNVLLQVMDHGTLTDALGRKTDFRNAILIMSSNVGAQEMSQNSIGFGDGDLQVKGLSQEALKKSFTPEFRNRIDAIVAFQPLKPEIVKQVVEKTLIKVQEQLKDKRILLHPTFEAIQWLGQKGYDPAYGARPIQRLVQKMVSQPLAKMILNKDVHRGQTVEIGVQDGTLTLTTVS